MKIKIDRESGIVAIKPRKIYPSGYDIEISFCNKYVCFTMGRHGTGRNVQITYKEWDKIKEIEVDQI